jgi:hypothetical protein
MQVLKANLPKRVPQSESPKVSPPKRVPQSESPKRVSLSESPKASPQSESPKASPPKWVPQSKSPKASSPKQVPKSESPKASIFQPFIQHGTFVRNCTTSEKRGVVFSAVVHCPQLQPFTESQTNSSITELGAITMPMLVSPPAWTRLFPSGLVTAGPPYIPQGKLGPVCKC